MLRLALLSLAIFAAAWLEFTAFPGHSYLEADTQIYLPMLERVDAPGLLARDLVATNPTLSLKLPCFCTKPDANPFAAPCLDSSSSSEWRRWLAYSYSRAPPALAIFSRSFLR
jgi:hypothetical protein